MMISVIVPVYNVEMYIDQCLKSIVNQTYGDLEIILINDGSTDNCGEICDKWALMDERICVIHQQNQGLSSARNAGMKIASGEFISFVDSDDWIHPQMFEKLLNSIAINNCDIAVCGAFKVFEDGTPTQNLTIPGNYIFDRAQGIEQLLKEEKIKYPVWNRLYSRSCVINELFPEGRLNEDVFWSYKIIAKAKRISVIETKYYFYRQRKNSIMSQSFGLKHLDNVDARVEQLIYIKNNFPNLTSLANTNLFYSCVYSGQMVLKYIKNPLERELGMKKLNRIIKTITINNFKTIGPPNFKQQIWQILALIDFGVTCKIRNYLKIGL